MKRFFTYCFFIFIAFQAGAQVKIDARLDSSSILIGDQVRLNVTIQHPKGITFQYPLIKDSLVSKVAVLESKIDTLRKSDSGMIVKQSFLLTSFDSGLYDLPGIRYPFTFQGRNDTLTTNPLQLMVNTLPVDTTSRIFDVKNILSVPITFKEMLPYILYGLLAALIIAVIVFVVLKWKRKEPLFVEKKFQEPPYVTAIRNLDALKEQKLWQQGKVKEFYSALTDILRFYLEGRYEIPAMESTTDEIIIDLKKHSGIIEVELFDKLKALLQSADLVKFAKAIPQPNENENSFSTAYDFVLKTKQIIAPETMEQKSSEPSKSENA